MKCFPALLYKKKIGSRNIDMRLWILLCTIEISALISAKNDSLTHSREVTHKRALPRRGWLTAGRLRRRGKGGEGVAKDEVEARTGGEVRREMWSALLMFPNDCRNLLSLIDAEWNITWLRRYLITIFARHCVQIPDYWHFQGILELAPHTGIDWLIKWPFKEMFW